MNKKNAPFSIDNHWALNLSKKKSGKLINSNNPFLQGYMFKYCPSSILYKPQTKSRSTVETSSRSDLESSLARFSIQSLFYAPWGPRKPSPLRFMLSRKNRV